MRHAYLELVHWPSWCVLKYKTGPSGLLAAAYGNCVSNCTIMEMRIVQCIDLKMRTFSYEIRPRVRQGSRMHTRRLNFL